MDKSTIQKVINKTNRNGNAVGDWRMKFTGKDIRNWKFFYRSKANVGFEVVEKTIGNGMYILGTDTVIIEGHIEERKPGAHTAYFTFSIDDKPKTFIQWNLTIEPKVTANS